MSLLDDLGESSEAVILQRARNGDGAAFGALYEQHLGAARRLARSLVADRSDADDVVAEVFAAAFAAMRKGLGPAADFRSYVLTSVRRESQRTWRKGARQRPGGDVVVDLATARGTPRDDFAWFDEGDVVHRAFAALPPRMQHVMWLTEIEGLSHDEVAVRMGTSSTNISQLARRARLEFGERYLDAHLPAPEGPVPTACVAPRRILAEVVRGTASRRAERVAAEHMAACPSCSNAEVELQVVNGRLRTGHLFVLLPALTVSKPARIGLFARLLAWAAGPVPTMSAFASLAVVAAVVPIAEDVPAPTPVPAVEVVVAPSIDSVPEASGVVEPTRRPVDASTFDPTVHDPDGLLRPLDPTAAVPGAATDAVTPEDLSPEQIVPGLALPGVDLPGTTLPGATLPTLPPLPDVTGAVERVVDGVTVDEPIVDAVGPVVSALPPFSVAVSLPPTPQLGPIGPTPPVAVGVGVAGGQIGVGVAAGPAAVEATVGGNGGVDVELPSVPEVVAALPAPVPSVVAAVPLVGGLVGPLVAGG